MARKPSSRSNATPPANPPIRSREALRKLSEMASKPVPPDRIRREVEGLVKAWLDGAGEDRRIEVREHLGEMGGQLAEGVEAAAEALDDMERDDEAGRRHAGAALQALRAAQAALEQAHRSL